MGEKKMSKSLGNVLDPFEVIERFGADALRFYLLPRGQLRPGRLDLDRRLRGPLRDRARQRLRQPRQPGAGDGRALPRRRRPRGRRRRGARARTSRASLRRFSELLDRAELTQALEEAWKLVRRLNRYVEETRPWELAKDEADPERLDEVLYNLAEGLRVTTLLLVPYLPRTSGRCSRRSARSRASSPSSARGGGGAGGRAAPAALPEDRGLGLRRAPRARAGPAACSRRAPSSGRARRGPSSAPFRPRPGRPAPGPRCRAARRRRRRRRGRAP